MDDYDLDAEFDKDFHEMEDQAIAQENEIEIMIKCAVSGIFGVVCVTGNILVLRTLLCFKHQKIPLYVLIGGLAVADILTVGFQIPQNMANWNHKGQMLTTELCKAIYYLVNACSSVSAFHLFFLSLFRCFMLNDRAHNKSYVIHSFVVSIGIWLVTLLANIPNAKAPVWDEIEGCSRDEGMGKDAERNTWLRALLSYIGPLVLILCVYIVTWYCTQRYFEDSYSHGERRLSRMVTLLVLFFAICQLPEQVITLIIFYKEKQMYENLNDIISLVKTKNITDTQGFSNDVFGRLNEVENVEEHEKYLSILAYCICLGSLDLAIRPIIYYKLSYYFRRGFDEIINCTVCKTDPRKRARRKRKRNRPSQSPLTEDEEEVAENECPEAPAGSTAIEITLN